MDYFEQCFERLIGHEGGYVFDARDPGGETRYGISKRAYPQIDIKALTLERAKAIYRRDYWDRCRCGELSEGVAFDVFDAAVNSGPAQAARWLQAAVGAQADGIIGPATLASVRKLPASTVLARLSGLRLDFMTSLPTWPAFGKGWARRIASNLKKVA